MGLGGMIREREDKDVQLTPFKLHLLPLCVVERESGDSIY